jgi:hypothetical protein
MAIRSTAHPRLDEGTVSMTAVEHVQNLEGFDRLAVRRTPDPNRSRDERGLSVHAFVEWPRCTAYDDTKVGLLRVTRAGDRS